MMQPIVSASTSESSSTTAAGSPLDRVLVRGLAWTGAVKWLSQILSWLSTIVVARLLAPEDYGVVAMAAAVLGLITLLNEFGLGAAVAPTAASTSPAQFSNSAPVALADTTCWVCS